MSARVWPRASAERQFSEASVSEQGASEMELLEAAVTYLGTVPVRALRTVSLRFEAGETVAVVGRSGSGKSTLLNVLGLLDRPTEGHYLVRDVDTSLLTESEITALRARQFGFVFQAFHLLADRTAAENVELGLLYRGTGAWERRRAAQEALEWVGLGHRLAALPGTLSGGERQRVAIARALAQRPRVLLCDEPTGNLDRRNSEMITGLLTDLAAEGLTLVVVTHDPEIAAAMHRRLDIDDGVVTDHSTAGGATARSALRAADQ
jgi:putative ABC transport system ATP-binding protein